MNTSPLIKTVFICTFALASQVFAASVEKQLFGNAPAPATCNCKNAADCTCKKGECKCKNCGNKARVFDTLKGSNEKTRLPDTARYEDARGGVAI